MLSRLIYQTKAFVMNASIEQTEVATKMDSIISRLDEIQNKQPEVMKELHKHLESSINHAVRNLGEYLKSDDVRARFTSWTLEEVPKAENSWKVTESNINKALENRMREIIDQWEEDRQEFSNARKSLLQHFQRRYNFVEGQLRILQGTVTDNALERIPADEGLMITTATKVVVGVTSPIWVPFTLVALLIGAPVVGIVAIKNKVQNMLRTKEYVRDKRAYMEAEAEDCLVYATKESVLKELVEDQLKEANLCLKQIEVRIPELIEADKMLCAQLRDERRSKKEIQEKYQPIMDKASDIRGHLAVFAFQEIRAADFSSQELNWKEEMSCRRRCGAFATVYQGKIKRQGEEQTAAIKVYSELLDATNASLFMTEVDLLR